MSGAHFHRAGGGQVNRNSHGPSAAGASAVSRASAAGGTPAICAIGAVCAARTGTAAGGAGLYGDVTGGTWAATGRAIQATARAKARAERCGDGMLTPLAARMTASRIAPPAASLA